MLQDAYGEEMVVEPHVLPVDTFNSSDAAGDTAHLPVLKKSTSSLMVLAVIMHHLLLCLGIHVHESDHDC